MGDFDFDRPPTLSPTLIFDEDDQTFADDDETPTAVVATHEFDVVVVVVVADDFPLILDALDDFTLFDDDFGGVWWCEEFFELLKLFDRFSGAAVDDVSLFESIVAF